MRNLANTALIVAFLAGLVLLPIARVPQRADHAPLIVAIGLCLGAGSGLLLTARTCSSVGCSAVSSPDAQ